LIEHDGEDLRDRPFLERKAVLARLLRDTEAGILLTEHVAEDGLTVFGHACRLGAEGRTAPIDPAHAASGSSVTRPASPCNGAEREVESMSLRQRP
jgi:bifunctional non-homologous end joining protein LigD